MSGDAESDDVFFGDLLVWSGAKYLANRRKHGVLFEEVVDVLLDPLLLYEHEEEWIHDELRWRVIGVGASGVLFVVYVDWKSRFRIISARKATDAEKQRYLDQT